MKNQSVLLGMHLVAASLVTWAWTGLCPKMTINGTTFLSIEGPGKGMHYCLDPVAFTAGTIIIWGITLGVYFILKGYWFENRPAA